MAEGWSNCVDCGCRYKWDTCGFHRHRNLCLDCTEFLVQLGPMDFRLLQCQRSCLAELADSPHLTDEESDVLQGIEALLDHIVDQARKSGRKVPSLEEAVLERLSNV